jgi:hypothetical protein
MAYKLFNYTKGIELIVLKKTWTKNLETLETWAFGGCVIYGKSGPKGFRLISRKVREFCKPVTL